MLRTHYRQPIDWTVTALEESGSHAEPLVRRRSATSSPASEIVDVGVLDALGDDLNTPAARRA